MNIHTHTHTPAHSFCMRITCRRHFHTVCFDVSIMMCECVWYSSYREKIHSAFVMTTHNRSNSKNMSEANEHREKRKGKKKTTQQHHGLRKRSELWCTCIFRVEMPYGNDEVKQRPLYCNVFQKGFQEMTKNASMLFCCFFFFFLFVFVFFFFITVVVVVVVVVVFRFIVLCVHLNMENIKENIGFFINRLREIENRTGNSMPSNLLLSTKSFLHLINELENSRNK